MLGPVGFHGDKDKQLLQRAQAQVGIQRSLLDEPLHPAEYPRKPADVEWPEAPPLMAYGQKYLTVVVDNGEF